ncbi:hypothetical protein H0484_01310 [Pusillimonas sp. CC-YST705]|uniref:Autotransporter domain-containing protein n=1 Tax=Mesopusillimonas faecipullorum TaxID=2755040 RepID=A0ABS8C8P1_9BURK|nr:hypothetical protein [Mesopusillimonas faecipullorum]MCB5362393.1 hypothetical protein [Mesopusillimonas faecipullorum]
MTGMIKTKDRGVCRDRALYSLLCCAVVSSAIPNASAQAATSETVAIVLKHVPSDDDAKDFDALGIMIGVNGSQPRLYQFDTGSDMFIGQIEDAPGVVPVPGVKPDLYSYGDGTYGYWMQQVMFEQLSYHNPDRPTELITNTSGSYIAARMLDWVYSKQHDGFQEHKVSDKPVGTREGTHYYADLEVRERIRKGEPSDHPPFYGTYGAGNFTDYSTGTSAPGGQTKTGYVISANANMGDKNTPGCAPCLNLHLTPSMRAQFTALMPWGKLDYETAQRHFPGSGANASNEHDGNFSYTISVPIGKKKRAVDFKGPILFDTGNAEFLLVDADAMLKKFRAKGFKLAEYDNASVDIKFYGFDDKLNNLEYEDITISRLADEDEGNTLTVGLPFFQQNSVMYDLANRITAYSPYFVTVGDFSTDRNDGTATHLAKINEDIGSSGWIGLAGSLSGSGDFVLEKGANVRMTGVNTYTGATRIAKESYLHLAGPGSIEHSSHIVIDGLFYIDQKGAHMDAWGVNQTSSDAVVRNIEGTGDILLGPNRLVLTAASGRFDGTITDYGNNDKNMGGGLVVAAGRLILGNTDNDYSGLTEVAAGAELHVTGELTGDVAVSGKLVVDGTVHGTVTVKEGGQLLGTGAVGVVNVLPGGSAARLKAIPTNG